VLNKVGYPKTTNNVLKPSKFQKVILSAERLGNKIPHPLTIFIILIAILFIISHFTQGIVVKLPGTDDEIITQSLLKADFVRSFLKNIPKNFVDFPALRYALVIILGTAVCEYSGLFNAVMKRFVANASNTLIATIVVFLSLNGNLIGDSAFVFIPTLAGVVYAAKGRNPILGIATSYACVNGGHSAAIMFGSSDAILYGITESVMQLLPITQNYSAHVAMNWYFLAVSAILLTPVAVYVSEKIIAPIVEGSDVFNVDKDIDYYAEAGLSELEPIEHKGLKYAGISLLTYIIIILVLTIPQGAFFRNTDTGNILPKSPFMDSIVMLMTFLFLIPGITYGITVGKIKKDRDVANYMVKGITSMAGFIVIVFGASQFVACFKDTNLATLIAIRGTEFIKAINLKDVPLVIVFILFMSFLNLFVVSASAKWAMVAPIFVPMFALLGYSPAFAQALYNVGNSCTNIITPLSSGLAIVLGMMSRYKKDTGLGTLISLMIPFSIAFLFFWTALSIIFLLFNLPLGPNAGIYL